MGKKFLTADQQEEAGILTPEVKARLAAAYAAGEAAAPAAVEAAPPGQTALFNSWEDAVECSKCGGRMVQDRQLLHLPRLRHEHRLQLTRPTWLRASRGRRCAQPRSVSGIGVSEAGEVAGLSVTRFGVVRRLAAGFPRG